MEFLLSVRVQAHNREAACPKRNTRQPRFSTVIRLDYFRTAVLISALPRVCGWFTKKMIVPGMQRRRGRGPVAALDGGQQRRAAPDAVFEIDLFLRQIRATAKTRGGRARGRGGEGCLPGRRANSSPVAWWYGRRQWPCFSSSSSSSRSRDWEDCSVVAPLSGTFRDTTVRGNSRFLWRSFSAETTTVRRRPWTGRTWPTFCAWRRRCRRDSCKRQPVCGARPGGKAERRRPCCERGQPSAEKLDRAIECALEPGKCSDRENGELADSLEAFKGCLNEQEDCEQEQIDRQDVTDILRMDAELTLRRVYLNSVNLFKERVEESVRSISDKDGDDDA